MNRANTFPSRTLSLGNDNGYATVTSVGIIAAVTSLLLVVAAVGAQVIARHEAQVAADMAAIAGAWAHATGEDACAVAGEIAAANDAQLDNCREEDRDVIVTASVRGKEASAKAGPI